MSKYSAETSDALFAEKYFRDRDLAHLRARKYGSYVIIESGPDSSPVKHARFRRETVHYWTLEMGTHRGKWEKTVFRDQLSKLLEMLVEDFGWVLTPIE